MFPCYIFTIVSFCPDLISQGQLFPTECALFSSHVVTKWIRLIFCNLKSFIPTHPFFCVILSHHCQVVGSDYFCHVTFHVRNSCAPYFCMISTNLFRTINCSFYKVCMAFLSRFVLPL